MWRKKKQRSTIVHRTQTRKFHMKERRHRKWTTTYLKSKKKKKEGDGGDVILSSIFFSCLLTMFPSSSFRARSHIPPSLKGQETMQKGRTLNAAGKETDPLRPRNKTTRARTHTHTRAHSNTHMPGLLHYTRVSAPPRSPWQRAALGATLLPTREQTSTLQYRVFK